MSRVPALVIVFMLTALGSVQAQFKYTGEGNSITITGYTGSGGDVIIPTNINGLTVISIGPNAFANSHLTSITIPGSVTDVGEWAFAGNPLTNVTIDDSADFVGLTYIANWTFSGCTNLASITLPNNVTIIGEGVFQFCTSLTNVTIGNGVTSIGGSAFTSCTDLNSINVGTNNQTYSSVNGVLFNHSQTMLIQYPEGNFATSFAIPYGVTTIESNAFYHCTNLASLTIPNSVINIGAGAFGFCTRLTSVTIGNGVSTIEFDAFYGCTSLTNATIGKSVSSIGDEAFADCTSLTSVFFTGNAPDVFDSTAFNGDSSNPVIYYLPGTTGWSSPFAPRALLWNPLVQSSGTNFGAQSNQFGFIITGTPLIPVKVEACTNLANPVWTPLQTITLATGLFGFSDAQWSTYPARFYRITAP